jgi:two-component system response regulator HydG
MTSERDSMILVVDDDEDTASLLCELLQRRGYRAEALSSGERCLEYLRSGIADVVITDVRMPGMSGIELCRELHVRHPDLLAIVLTGMADLESAVSAIRAGAYDFITKPVKADLLEIAIERAREHLAVRREVQRLRPDPATAVEGIVGTSPAIRRTIELTRRAAVSDATVLVTGESGTGKELVARALHHSSSRANAPFVALNCGAVPASLLESELFGHVRGAFTDAKRSRAGLFVQAGNGTLLLDEIGEIPLDMQVKLLRALQERKVRPVGADEEQPFACRIVAATNRDLEQEIVCKRFRKDLFYRINVVVIPVPPLRERETDIIELARVFAASVARRAGRPALELSPSAAQLLTAYDWPGNVRELENCIERAVAIARGPIIEVSDLPEKIAKFEPTRLVIATDTPEEMITLDELHRRYVRRVLAAVKGNKTLAAKVLGIDRRSLYRRLENFGIGSATATAKAKGEARATEGS